MPKTSRATPRRNQNQHLTKTQHAYQIQSSQSSEAKLQCIVPLISEQVKEHRHCGEHSWTTKTHFQRSNAACCKHDHDANQNPAPWVSEATPKAATSSQINMIRRSTAQLQPPLAMAVDASQATKPFKRCLSDKLQTKGRHEIQKAMRCAMRKLCAVGPNGCRPKSLLQLSRASGRNSS